MASVVYPFQLQSEVPRQNQAGVTSKIPFIFTIDPEQINCFDFSPSEFNVFSNIKKRNVIHAQTFPYASKPKEKPSLTRSNSWSFDLSI